MKVYILIVLVVGTTLAKKAKSGSGEKFPCNSQKEAAEASGADYVPQCNERGRFIKKQCDSQKCWCVTRRRGRRLFKDVRIPLNHHFDCHRKPQVCLREELQLLMAGESQVPQCDCFGFYEEKQCEIVNSAACKKKKKNKNNGRKKRDADEECRGTPSFLGFAVEARETTDRAKTWTFVSKIGFLSKGKLTAFEVFVGETGRPLRLGVYRPNGGDCTFTLIKQLEFASLPAGYQRVTLSAAQEMMVEEGDRYGFTWTDFGVVTHTKNTKDNFCEAPQTFVEGDVAALNSDNGRREYSIRFEFVECRAFDDEVQSTCDGDESTLGNAPLARTKIDVSVVWTIVDTRAFPEAGEVNSIELYVTGANREIRVGQYRPTGDGNDMTLIQQKSWSGFQEGVVMIELLGNDIMKVKAGDHVGITWVNHGVVPYENSPGESNYLGSSSSYNVGDVAMLSPSAADRAYSFRVNYKECEGDDSGGPNPSCEQCFCVDRTTGEEIDNTRTTGDLECGNMRK